MCRKVGSGAGEAPPGRGAGRRAPRGQQGRGAPRSWRARRPAPLNELEVEAKRQLQVPGVVGFPRDFPESSQVIRIGSDAVPVRMIENVESFGAELESDALVDRELLEQRQVPIVEAGVVDDVACG